MLGQSFHRVDTLVDGARLVILECKLELAMIIVKEGTRLGKRARYVVESTPLLELKIVPLGKDVVVLTFLDLLRSWTQLGKVFWLIHDACVCGLYVAMNEAHFMEFLYLVDHSNANLASAEEGETLRGEVEDAPKGFVKLLGHDVDFVSLLDNFVNS
jgi:hypothetical protein